MAAEAVAAAAVEEAEVARLRALKDSARTAASREALAASSSGQAPFSRRNGRCMTTFVPLHVSVVIAVGKYMAAAKPSLKRAREEDDDAGQAK